MWQSRQQQECYAAYLERLNPQIWYSKNNSSHTMIIQIITYLRFAFLK